MNPPSKIPPPTKIKLPSSFVTPKVNTGGFKTNVLRRRSKSVSDMSNVIKPLPSINRGFLKPVSSSVQRATSQRQLNKMKEGDYKVLKPLNTNMAGTAKKPIKRNAPISTTKRPAPKETESTKPKMAKIAPYDYKARFERLLKDHKELKGNYTALSENSSSITEAHEKVSNELEKLKMDFEIISGKYNELDKRYNELEISHSKLQLESEQISNENKDLKNKLEFTQKQIMDYDNNRRNMHNIIQDLKGNIRVFCRIRPALQGEDERLMCSLNVVDEVGLEIRKSRDTFSATGRVVDLKQEFVFDKVFGPESTQDDVFEDLAQLVQSVLDGFNVCVFAYGQTGSGKTYTMQGSSNNLGMIPKTIKLLFEKIDLMKNQDWTYTMEASFLEIYNETIKDLLTLNTKEKLEILHNDGKGSTVRNLTSEKIRTEEHLFELIKKANSNRAVATTSFNEHSSRSHAVTKLEITGSNSRTKIHLQGSISLVDLAGSENAKFSERMAETKNINKSLSNLGTVMFALHNKDSYVPYRNSKLTYLLQSSLGGNSKTLMFVNISPFEDCYNETVNSLRFASKVKEVKTVARRQKINK